MMTRIFKKLTAVLLVLITVVGLFPTSVLAAQTDSEGTGADLVSLTVYGIMPSVTPIKSIKPDPVNVTTDIRGYPVYWYAKGTRITELMFNRPNVYDNVWLRCYIIGENGGTQVINRNTPYTEYLKTYGLGAFNLNQNMTLYQVWAKGVSHSDGDDTDEYNHISFEYNSSQVEINFPHEDSKEVFWDFNRMAAYEPVDFAAYGKNGYYVSDIRYLFKDYRTDRWAASALRSSTTP